MRVSLFALSIACLTLSFEAHAQQKAIATPSNAKALPENKANTSRVIDQDKIYIVEKRKLKYYALPDVQLTSVQTEKITSKPDSRIQLPTDFTPQVSISMERKQPIAYILIPKYSSRADGSVEQLISYTLDIREQNAPKAKTAGNRVYAANSVLSSGNWYQISLENKGVYKIDYAFIKNNMGVDLAGKSSSLVRLYGNGGEMLVENNNVARADDLVENAIAMFDGGDGTFDNGDYFLFYANGPHTILKDSADKRFKHLFNLYSNSSNYFLNFDKPGGKRIAMQSGTLNANVNVNSYNDFYFYEKDSVNPGKFGKTWYGDEFNDQPGRYLTRSYNLTFPNTDLSTPVHIRSRYGAISYTATSTMNVFANENLLHSTPLALIGQSYSDPVLRIADVANAYTLTGPNLNLRYTFTKGGSSAYGYLDFFEINLRRNLIFDGYLNFADWNSVGPGNVANYVIQNVSTNTQVWDITNPLEPVQMNANFVGNTLSFSQEASYLHRFVATDGTITLQPTYKGNVPNQNLHGQTAKDYIIVTPNSLRGEAERLAVYHTTKRGYKSLIVTPQEIYNEFSSGSQDVSAIRDFIKMFYDRGNVNDIPKYLLFFGDASYDYKDRINNNTNLVPVYETWESINKTTGYCTDDFFGFLDDEEDINNYSFTHSNTLDVGIGRITVSTVSKAADVVNKIINYDSPKSFGPWKNNMTFNADDGDYAIHLEDAELMSGFIADSLPVYNNYKIYVDGYVQQSTPAGPRTPDANKAVVANLYNGTFLVNYNGHGGPLGWCEERIFSMDDVNYLTNFNKLPLFITATCDFAPFDNPSINSAGEILLTKANGGAIALMTTTQLVYADQNRIMNLNYMKEGFTKMDNGQYPTLGDAYRLSKNLRYVSSIDEFAASNFRKFALLGDPALPLAFPKHRVFTDSINGVSVAVAYDTLKALGKYTISGHIADQNGNLLSSYNGVVYPTLFDKAKKLTTLQNDADSPKRDYSVQNSTIYKGKATVKNGKFSFTFVVPKDINYAIDLGKLSYYASNETEDANGYDKKIFIGGSSNNAIADNEGPTIKPFLNDEKFVNGGITTPNSTLLVKLFDENGINYTGNSVGHDITAILDGNAQNTYILNDFYEAEQDDYKSGTVRFPLNNLNEGQHTLTIKAWDVLNNSSEATLNFVVKNNNEGALANVYNYPNPFTTQTQFMFEHNMPNENIYVSINIYTISGKVVKTIRTMVNTPGTRVNNINWDGKDEYGEKLGKGVYLYKLSIKGTGGFSDSKLQKLILL